MMDERLGHAKAIGILVGVCLAVALLLGMDLFFVLVLVYRAGWLKSLASLIGLGVAAAVLAAAQVYMLARVAAARQPELLGGMKDYCRAHKLVVLVVLAAVLAAVCLAVGAFLG